MKKFIKLAAIAAILAPAMFSCSGGGSSSEAPLFGSLPETYGKFVSAKDALKAEAENIKSEADKAKFLEKAEKMQEEWAGKIEEAAKSLDGKPVEFAEGEFKITEPVSLQFDRFFSKSDLTPAFNVNGQAEAAAEIVTELDYVLPSEGVHIVGYDAEGQEVYDERIGSVNVENRDGKVVVPAGSAVKFDSFRFGKSDAESCPKIATLKLEFRR